MASTCVALRRLCSPLHAHKAFYAFHHVSGCAHSNQIYDSPPRRFLSTSPNSSSSPAVNDNDSQRHPGILLHPESIANEILPGNIVMKKLRNGNVKRRYTELVYGYFWMIKDLKRTADKPLQTTIIPEKQSKVLPLLENVANLCGESVQLPGYLLRRNKSNDPLAQSTLLAVSFRDFGYQQLASWVNPFRQQFCSSDRVEVYKLLISEGWLTRYFLRQVIQASVKSNTPVEDYRNTLLHFSSDSDVFRDPLRMHNLMSGYIFLLDGMGRVRLAGSGPASTEDVDTLIRLTNDLTLWNHNSAMKKKR